MDIYILLTGDDSITKKVADQAVEKFGCYAQVDLRDWLYQDLSDALPGLTESDFLEGKEFEKELVIGRGPVHKLMRRLGERGFNNVNRVSTMKWWGRAVNSTSQLVKWFGDEVVTKNCGIAFHAQQTLASLTVFKRISTTGDASTIVITGFTHPDQVTLFKKELDFVYPILVDSDLFDPYRDSFPSDDFFFARIDGDSDSLEEGIANVFYSIRDDIGHQLKST